MKKTIIIPILILIILFTVSCNKTTTTDNPTSNNNEEIENLQNEIAELKLENEKLKQIIEDMGEEKELPDDEKEILDNYREYNTDYTSEEEFEWMNFKNWDKIAIYVDNGFDKTNITVTDKKIIPIKPIDLTGKLTKISTNSNDANQEGISYFEGNDNIKYVYIFKSGNDSYKIEVISDNILFINGETYKAEKNAELLGQSMIEHKYIYKLENIIDKAINSNLCVKKEYTSLVINPDGTYEVSDNFNYNYYMESKLYKEIIEAITNSMKKIDRPLLADNINCFPVAELTYYYNGEMINVDVYYNYIHIYDMMESYWYETTPSNIEYMAHLIEQIM